MSLSSRDRTVINISSIIRRRAQSATRIPVRRPGPLGLESVVPGSSGVEPGITEMRSVRGSGPYQQALGEVPRAGLH